MSGKIKIDVSTPENYAWFERIRGMVRRERDELIELRRDLATARRVLGCPLIERICDAAEKWLHSQERLQLRPLPPPHGTTADPASTPSGSGEDSGLP